ncbi:alpha/beta hydrolase [Peribacillus frigoritolerans]|nr:alpha/beta hydrolase [Peribacillus frigoritolerans]USK73973.1 alpha/beta hydrolase [Peribacillus frigoritolerans]
MPMLDVGGISLHYSVNLPTLLIYGEKDKPMYRHAYLLHEKLPYTELRFIDHVNHQIPTKAANDLNESIKHFIQSRSD